MSERPDVSKLMDVSSLGALRLALMGGAWLTPLLLTFFAGCYAAEGRPRDAIGFGIGALLASFLGMLTLLDFHQLGMRKANELSRQMEGQ